MLFLILQMLLILVKFVTMSLESWHKILIIMLFYYYYYLFLNVTVFFSDFK